MKYDVDRFYALSERFKDNLSVMACVAAIAEFAKLILKDFSFGRYKDEHTRPLQTFADELTADEIEIFAQAVKDIIKKDKILSRDDFANIEAYSVFEKSYDKSGAKLRNKTKRPRRVKKEQLEFKF